MRRFVGLVGLLALGFGLAEGQDRWPLMPGYVEWEEARKVAGEIERVGTAARWDGDQVVYRMGGGERRFDLGTGVVSNGPDRGGLGAGPVPEPQQQPARGRQFTEVRSPDGTHRAFYLEGNLFLETDGDVKAITTEGDLAKKIKFGNGSWVYGEELGQRHAIGFSPDSKKIWFYGFDESPVETYWLTLGQRDQQVTLYPEAYPKPGKKNPEVDLFAYDIPTGKTTKVVVRPGAFDDGVGHYVYAITWGADSRELYFHRMDRRQKVRELCAADPGTGAVRVIDRVEHQPTWVEPDVLRDVRTPAGRGANPDPMPAKILFLDEPTGFLNLYWLDTLTGERQAVTRLGADVFRVVAVDEAKELIYFMAGDGATPYRHQLHVVGFDGSGHRRLTDPEFHHTVSFNEAKTAFTDEAQNAETLPKLAVRSVDGGLIKDLGQASVPDMKGFRPRQWFTAPTFDGTTTLYGAIDFPRNFDPAKKYPVMVSVYGGPGGAGAGPSETWALSNANASSGFLWVKVYGRAENGRGRAFRQAIYQKMGIVEIDDQAAGVKALAQFPWADTSRVGIYGTSYGGYASAMAVLRYPELFHAACSSSMVSQWTNYDTTYTERYMNVLEDNRAGYEAGSCMTYASTLKGWLMLYYGTADDNTHPSNTLQLAEALSRAGKSYELQVGVDRGHTGLGFPRMMEFFVERLVVDGPRR